MYELFSNDMVDWVLNLINFKKLCLHATRVSKNLLTSSDSIKDYNSVFSHEEKNIRGMNSGVVLPLNRAATVEWKKKIQIMLINTPSELFLLSSVCWQQMTFFFQKQKYLMNMTLFFLYLFVLFCLKREMILYDGVTNSNKKMYLSYFNCTFFFFLAKTVMLLTNLKKVSLQFIVHIHIFFNLEKGRERNI